MASIRIESTPTPSPLDVVELKPPADSGFSGTAFFHAVTQAALVEELLKRGYTRVTAK